MGYWVFHLATVLPREPALVAWHPLERDLLVIWVVALSVASCKRGIAGPLLLSIRRTPLLARLTRAGIRCEVWTWTHHADGTTFRRQTLAPYGREESNGRFHDDGNED
jgi:hypothetical protein